MPDSSSSTLRPAVPDDLHALAAIDARCFPRGIAYPAEEIAALLQARSALTLIAERAAVIVGFASMRLLRRSPLLPRRGELVTIDVIPEFRRAGLGGELHRALEDWLAAVGGTSIELHVSVSNTEAIDFYQRLDYSVIARVPLYYLETIDAWKMEKLLSPRDATSKFIDE